MTYRITAPKSERIAHILGRAIRLGALLSGNALENENARAPLFGQPGTRPGQPDRWRLGLVGSIAGS